jgi:hypothetical protein
MNMSRRIVDPWPFLAFRSERTVCRLVVTACLCWLAFSVTASAHEVTPSIADLSVKDGVLTLDVRLSLEGFIAGIDLTDVIDTNAAGEAATYDALRALEGSALEARFRAFWPDMAGMIVIRSGGRALRPELVSVTIPEVGDTNLVRTSEIRIQADLPAIAARVELGWARAFGALVVRQIGVEDGYEAYLEGGSVSAPIDLTGGSRLSGWQTGVRYIAIGFSHIVPKGLDHILFVLGLFFLSPAVRALLWQVSAFTLAHTVTLALSALGVVSISPDIVEPLIAATIVFVAVENIFVKKLHAWRPPIVLGFGLLHGLGFASVLTTFGLPQGGFFAALIGFNIGVELGQLAVIGGAFLVVGFWFRRKTWYRAAIAIPASGVIAAVGLFWFVERVAF